MTHSTHSSREVDGVQTSLHSHLMDKSWILDWRTFLFFCSDFVTTDWCYRLKLFCRGFQSAPERTRVTQTFLRAKGHDVTDTGCEVYPKGAIASEKQRGVCECVCMSVQSNMVNKYIFLTLVFQWQHNVYIQYSVHSNGLCVSCVTSVSFSVTIRHRRHSKEYYGPLIDESMGEKRCECVGNMQTEQRQQRGYSEMTGGL